MGFGLIQFGGAGGVESTAFNEDFLNCLRRIKAIYFYSTRGHQHNMFTKKTTGKHRIISVQIHLQHNYVINLVS